MSREGISMFSHKILGMLKHYAKYDGSQLNVVGYEDVFSVEVTVPLLRQVTRKPVQYDNSNYKVGIKLTLEPDKEHINGVVFIEVLDKSRENIRPIITNMKELSDYAIDEQMKHLIKDLEFITESTYVYPVNKSYNYVLEGITNYVGGNKNNIQRIDFTQNKENGNVTGYINISTAKTTTLTEYSYALDKVDDVKVMVLTFEFNGVNIKEGVYKKKGKATYTGIEVSEIASLVENRLVEAVKVVQGRVF